MRNEKILELEILLRKLKLILIKTAINEQQNCSHTTIYQFQFTQHSMRICPSCGLEEWASHWSGLDTDYWTRRDFKPGELDNKDGRRIKKVESDEFYHCRIEGQPVPNYDRK
jgi:hypothetical protein